VASAERFTGWTEISPALSPSMPSPDKPFPNLWRNEVGLRFWKSCSLRCPNRRGCSAPTTWLASALGRSEFFARPGRWCFEERICPRFAIDGRRQRVTISSAFGRKCLWKQIAKAVPVRFARHGEPSGFVHHRFTARLPVFGFKLVKPSPQGGVCTPVDGRQEMCCKSQYPCCLNYARRVQLTGFGRGGGPSSYGARGTSNANWCGKSAWLRILCRLAGLPPQTAFTATTHLICLEPPIQNLQMLYPQFLITRSPETATNGAHPKSHTSRKTLSK